MPRVGFEPTIPVFERAKPVHALDRAAAVIGSDVLIPVSSFVRISTAVDKISKNTWV
jgi:hypothetical protein